MKHNTFDITDIHKLFDEYHVIDSKITDCEHIYKILEEHKNAKQIIDTCLCCGSNLSIIYEKKRLKKYNIVLMCEYNNPHNECTCSCEENCPIDRDKELEYINRVLDFFYFLQHKKSLFVTLIISSRLVSCISKNITHTKQYELVTWKLDDDFFSVSIRSKLFKKYSYGIFVSDIIILLIAVLHHVSQ